MHRLLMIVLNGTAIMQLATHLTSVRYVGAEFYFFRGGNVDNIESFHFSLFIENGQNILTILVKIKKT